MRTSYVDVDDDDCRAKNCHIHTSHTRDLSLSAYAAQVTVNTSHRLLYDIHTVLYTGINITVICRSRQHSNHLMLIVFFLVN